MEVHVRSDLRQGSSYEDDIGEGPLAGMHKTDEMGKFKEWTPRPERFREREYSRVRVGVADADGRDSWQEWRKAHPDRKGLGNIALHPYKLPTTPESVVFRGPLMQPREVSAVDQNYDMTEVNKKMEPAVVANVPQDTSRIFEPNSYNDIAAHDNGIQRVNSPQPVSITRVAPTEIVRHGVVYVPLTNAVQPPASAVTSVPVVFKDQNLMNALHNVVEEIRSSESEYTLLKSQLNTLQASSNKIKRQAAASQAQLKGFAGEEARILKALEDGDKEADCDPCQKNQSAPGASKTTVPIEVSASQPIAPIELVPPMSATVPKPIAVSEVEAPAKEEAPATAPAPIAVDNSDEVRIAEPAQADESVPAETPEETPAETVEEKSAAAESVEEAESNIENTLGGVAKIFEGEPRPQVPLTEPSPSPAPAVEVPEAENPASVTDQPPAVSSDESVDAAGSLGLVPGFAGKYYFFQE